MEYEFYEDNEYFFSLFVDADRIEDFEYEVRWFLYYFSFFREVIVEGFCIIKIKFIYCYEKYFVYYIYIFRVRFF